MFYYQKVLEREDTKHLTLYDFCCENIVYNYAYEHTIKSHLMTVKAKDGHPLILAVEFVTRRGISERGMVYFTPGNEAEVLELLKYNKFWNGIQICKPTTNQKTMFNSLLANAVECADNWNYKEMGMSEVVQELLNAKKYPNHREMGSKQRSNARFHQRGTHS